MTAQLVVDSPGVHEAPFGQLLAELKMVGAAVPYRAPAPVLAGVLLDARDGLVTASATDFEVSASTVLSGHYDGPDVRLLVNHADLVKQVTALGATVRKTADRATLPVRLDLAALTVEINGYTMPLEPLPVEDYPALPEAAPTVARVDRETFTELVNRVSVALGKDDTLPMLTGVNLRVLDGHLRLETTDRFRLISAGMDAITSTEAVALAPGKKLVEVLKELGKVGGDQVTIGMLSQERVTLTCGATQVSLQPHYSEFPKVDKLMPATTPGAIEVDRAAALTAAQTAKALLAAKSIATMLVRISVARPQDEVDDTPDESEEAGADTAMLTLVDNDAAEVDQSGEHAAAGEVRILPDLANREQQAAVKTPPMDAVLHGTPRELLSFQVDNLIGALANFVGERVVLHTQDGNKALVVTETIDALADPKSYRHLVMPIRIQDPPAEVKPAGTPPADAATAER
jgi:DNA polymerase III subunit beta